jgi:hypothetical protein
MHRTVPFTPPLSRQVDISRKWCQAWCQTRAQGLAISQTLAGRIGQLTNLAVLSNDVGVSATSLRNRLDACPGMSPDWPGRRAQRHQRAAPSVMS